MSESRDRNGAFLDLRGLASLMVDVTLEEALDRVLAAVRAHSAHGAFTDDVAVMLLEHTATGPEYLPLAGEHDWRESLHR